MNRKNHWEGVYAGKEPTELTWHQTRPEISLQIIRGFGLGPDAPIIDVGGGTSLLTGLLMDEGFRDLSVLDVSEKALRIAKEQLGGRAPEVQWFEADVLGFDPPRRWDLWHDRAVFHFLTSEEDQEAYRRALNRCLRPGGKVVIAGFDLEGPDRCSGLDVAKHSPETLQAVLGPGFRLTGALKEDHRTPNGSSQKFLYAWFDRVPGGPNGSGEDRFDHP